MCRQTHNNKNVKLYKFLTVRNAITIDSLFEASQSQLMSNRTYKRMSFVFIRNTIQ